MAKLMPPLVTHFDDDNGNPLVGGKVFFYEAGTSTPKNTFTDANSGIPNPNPVVLNARGDASIWLTAGEPYKAIIKRADDTVVNTVDFITRDAADDAAYAALESAEAARDVAIAQAGIATAQAVIATEQRVLSETARAGSEAARTGAESARDAALLSRGVFASTADALSKGVAALASLVAGTSGTNGTFDLAFSGGAGTGAAGRFIVAGGAVVSTVITATGRGYTSAPTVSFAASSGLTGASATAVIANNADVGEYFSVPVLGSNDFLILYKVESGPVATEVSRYPSSLFIANTLDTTGYNESGYAWALVDAQYKIAIAVLEDGSVEIGNQTDVGDTLALVDTYFEEYGTHSGYAWALVDAQDNMVMCVRKDGKLEVAGQYIARQVDLTALNARIYGSSDSKSIVAWGDSLTEGTGGTSYPSQLSALLNTSVLNEGFGGQTTKKIISRQGGASALVTVAGNSIPASGAVAVTLDISLLSYPTSSTISITGYLNGILGTLTKDTSNNYSFARSVAGDAKITPPNTQFVVTKSTRNSLNTQLDYGINLFWCGSNDVGTSTISDVATLIEQAVSHIKTPEKRFLIMGPLNSSAFTASTQAYIDMRVVTDQLKAAYPANFIDIQELLLYHYNSGIPQDVTDFGNKVVPSSLRIDSIHLNTTGYAIVANAVKSFIDAKRWLS